MIRFDGQVAIVTGAGKGIGRAYAETLAARGAKVVVNNRRHAGEAGSSADEVVAAIRAKGGQAVPNYDAVDAPGAGERLVATALEAFGDLHILMCNAAIGARGMLHKQTEADMRAFVEINLLGSLEPARAAIAHMRERKYGRILLTSSSAAMAGALGFAAYGATKAAMHGLAASATLEADRNGVLINIIQPSAFTDMIRWTLPVLGVDEATRAAQLPVQPVAEAAAYMVSREFEGRAEVWSVAGGHVHVVRLVRSPGIDIPADELTAERIAGLAAQVRDMADGRLIEPNLPRD
jgi:NAD(P)-dependent dehydrogenase (short-subunit alcohol dehydrogenase family)